MSGEQLFPVERHRIANLMIERVELVHAGELQGIKVKWRELGWDALIGEFAPQGNSVNRENAALCLDLTIEVIRRKGDHVKAGRIARTDKPFEMPPAYIGQPLFKQPKTESEVVHTLQSDETYRVHHVLSGFDPTKTFYHISCFKPDGERINGFIEQQPELLVEPSGSSQENPGDSDDAIPPDNELRSGFA